MMRVSTKVAAPFHVPFTVQTPFDQSVVGLKFYGL
jgi:hypothetical protein